MTSDAGNDMSGKSTDHITEAINDLLRCGKDLFSEASLSNLFSNLFDRLHLRSIGWVAEKNNILGYLWSPGLVTCRAITAKRYNVIRILFGRLPQKVFILAVLQWSIIRRYLSPVSGSTAP